MGLQRKVPAAGQGVRDGILAGQIGDGRGELQRVLAGRDCRAVVEVRCYAEYEMDSLTASRTSKDSKRRGEGSPLAVLVSLQEDQTCAYQARACMLLLCPVPAGLPSAAGALLSSVVHGTGTAASSNTMEDPEAQTNGDPLGALLDALLGGEAALG